MKPTRSGQAMTEMVILIPLLVMLAAGAISVSYMCWQGVKVQEAANLAARIAGQETVGTARDRAQVGRDNGLDTSLGVYAAGDPDPNTACNQADSNQRQNCLDQFVKTNGSGSSGGVGGYGTKLDGNANGAQGVYWNYRRLVYSLFSPGEQKQLFVQPAITRGDESEVKVSRVMRPPKIFGWQMPIVTVEAKAYGGEDTYMYSLKRAGHTNNNAQTLWEKLMQNPNLKDKDAQADQ